MKELKDIFAFDWHVFVDDSNKYITIYTDSYSKSIRKLRAIYLIDGIHLYPSINCKFCNVL